MRSVFFSPGFMPSMAFSKPGMTCPPPMVKMIGSLPWEESNSVPSSSVPR